MIILIISPVLYMRHYNVTIQLELAETGLFGNILKFTSSFIIVKHRICDVAEFLLKLFMYFLPGNQYHQGYMCSTYY